LENEEVGLNGLHVLNAKKKYDSGKGRLDSPDRE
jgi:hypothetical protein